MRPSYSAEFKQSVVQKISTPGGPSFAQMAKNLGVHYTYIYGWVKDHANTTGMKKSKEWTLEEKLPKVMNRGNIIPMEDQQKLFHQFQRGEGAIKGVQKAEELDLL